MPSTASEANKSGARYRAARPSIGSSPRQVPTNSQRSVPYSPEGRSSGKSGRFAMSGAESACFGSTRPWIQVPARIIDEPIKDVLGLRRPVEQALLELRSPVDDLGVAGVLQPQLKPTASQACGQRQQQIDQVATGARRPEPEFGALCCGNERAPRDGSSLVRVGRPDFVARRDPLRRRVLPSDQPRNGLLPDPGRELGQLVHQDRPLVGPRDG